MTDLRKINVLFLDLVRNVDVKSHYFHEEKLQIYKLTFKIN